MDKEIKEYSEAVKEHISVCAEEHLIKAKLQKCRYRLLRASQALRMKQQELLEDSITTC